MGACNREQTQVKYLENYGRNWIRTSDHIDVNDVL